MVPQDVTNLSVAGLCLAGAGTGEQRMLVAFWKDGQEGEQAKALHAASLLVHGSLPMWPLGS